MQLTAGTLNWLASDVADKTASVGYGIFET
jgi:hypothetical protein